MSERGGLGTGVGGLGVSVGAVVGAGVAAGASGGMGVSVGVVLWITIAVADAERADVAGAVAEEGVTGDEAQAPRRAATRISAAALRTIISSRSGSSDRSRTSL